MDWVVVESNIWHILEGSVAGVAAVAWVLAPPGVGIVWGDVTWVLRLPSSWYLAIAGVGFRVTLSVVTRGRLSVVSIWCVVYCPEIRDKRGVLYVLGVWCIAQG